MDASRPPPGFMKNVRVMFDVRDVVDDVNTVVSESVQQTTDNLTGGWGGRQGWVGRRGGSEGRALSCAVVAVGWRE